MAHVSNAPSPACADASSAALVGAASHQPATPAIFVEQVIEGDARPTASVRGGEAGPRIFVEQVERGRRGPERLAAVARVVCVSEIGEATAWQVFDFETREWSEEGGG